MCTNGLKFCYADGSPITFVVLTERGNVCADLIKFHGGVILDKVGLFNANFFMISPIPNWKEAVGLAIKAGKVVLDPGWIMACIDAQDIVPWRQYQMSVTNVSINTTPSEDRDFHELLGALAKYLKDSESAEPIYYFLNKKFPHLKIAKLKEMHETRKGEIDEEISRIKRLLESKKDAADFVTTRNEATKHNIEALATSGENGSGGSGRAPWQINVPPTPIPRPARPPITPIDPRLIEVARHNVEWSRKRPLSYANPSPLEQILSVSSLSTPTVGRQASAPKSVHLNQKTKKKAGGLLARAKSETSYATEPEASPSPPPFTRSLMQSQKSPAEEIATGVSISETEDANDSVDVDFAVPASEGNPRDDEQGNDKLHAGVEKQPYKKVTAQEFDAFKTFLLEDVRLGDPDSDRGRFTRFANQYKNSNNETRTPGSWEGIYSGYLRAELTKERVWTNRTKKHLKQPPVTQTEVDALRDWIVKTGWQPTHGRLPRGYLSQFMEYYKNTRRGPVRSEFSWGHIFHDYVKPLLNRQTTHSNPLESVPLVPFVEEVQVDNQPQRLDSQGPSSGRGKGEGNPSHAVNRHVNVSNSYSVPFISDGEGLNKRASTMGNRTSALTWGGESLYLAAKTTTFLDPWSHSDHNLATEDKDSDDSYGSGMA